MYKTILGILLISANVTAAEYRFDYLFPDLPPHFSSVSQLQQIGRPSATKQPAYMEDSQHRGTDNNASVAVGHTYVGQLLTHDLSFEQGSELLGKPVAASEVKNRSSPWLDLDTLYHHYNREALRDQQDPAKLRLGSGAGNSLDFPRDAAGKAQIPDQRNDENNNLAQLAAAVMRFHNVQADRLRAHDQPEAELFELARRETIRHWQAIILSEYLPLFVPQPVLQDVLDNGARYYTSVRAASGILPIEFAVAVNRFGHSMVRGRYTLNDRFHRVRLFPLSRSEFDRNLAGHRPIPAQMAIQWQRFFDFENSIQGRLDDDEDQFRGLQVGRKIDRLLARPMLRLPVSDDPGLPHEVLDADNRVVDRTVVSLPTLNLMRSRALAMPSGQAIARVMGIEPLSNAQLGLCNPGDPCDTSVDIELTEAMHEAPLFLYILEEAKRYSDGETLGEVGGRIMAEVVIGLLRNSPYSIVQQPFVSPYTGTSAYTMADLLYNAGMTDARPEVK